MTFEEYTEQLELLRREYSESIKGYARTTFGIDLIERTQIEVEEYRLRVARLQSEYRGELQTTT